MDNSKSQERTATFSLHEASKPKLSFGQIRVDGSNQSPKVGLPKSPQKLTVGRTGKIGFTKQYF